MPAINQYPQLKAKDGSDNVEFTQAGVSATPRSVQDKLRDMVSVKDFGAVGNGIADDTIAIQNAITAAATTKKVLFLSAGTYRVTSTLVKPESFDGLSIEGEGFKSTIIDYTSIAPNSPCIQIIGGSGQLCNADVRGIKFLGNANSIGIEIRDQCGQQISFCQFDNNAEGVQFHNSAVGGFTEYCQIDSCDFTSNCATPIRYRRTNGNDSFHGSGLIGKCTINTNTTGFNLIQIDSACNVYNAPLYVQVWTTNASGNIIRFSGTTPRPVLYGVLTIEHMGTGLTTIASTAANYEIAFAGTITSNNELIQLGSILQCVSAHNLASGARQTVGGRYRIRKAMTTGSNTISELPFPLAESSVLYSIHLHANNYDYRYVVAAFNSFANGTPAVVATLATFNSAGYGAPTFSLNANDGLIITNAGFPASGVVASIDVTQLGASLDQTWVP